MLNVCFVSILAAFAVKKGAFIVLSMPFVHIGWHGVEHRKCSVIIACGAFGRHVKCNVPDYLRRVFFYAL